MESYSGEMCLCVITPPSEVDVLHTHPTRLCVAFLSPQSIGCFAVLLYLPVSAQRYEFD